MKENSTTRAATDLTDIEQKAQKICDLFFRSLQKEAQNGEPEEMLFLGFYRPKPKNEIVQRVRSYAKERISAVARELQELDPQTQEIVIADYLRVVTGSMQLQANREQMLETTEKIKDARAFQVDRYGLYFGLLNNYRNACSAYDNLREGLKDEEKKKKLIGDTVNGSLPWQEHFANYQAIGWEPLRGADFSDKDIDPSGICFYTVTQMYADMFRYLTFYCIARGAANCERDELKDLNKPQLICYANEDTLLDKSEEIFKNLQSSLDNLAVKYADFISARTEEERRKAKKQIQKASNDSVRVYIETAKILSRPLSYFNRRDESGRPTSMQYRLALASYINEDRRAKGLPNISSTELAATAQVVEMVLAGVALTIANKGTQASAETNPYCETNITEILRASGCSGKSAGMMQKALFALHFLDGREICYNGSLVIKALVFDDKHISGRNRGKFRVYLHRELAKRAFTVEGTTYKALTRGKKEPWQTRLKNQILTKEHKEEEALLNEVFGYEERVQEERERGYRMAQHLTLFDDEETQKEANPERVWQNIKKNKGRDRKKVIAYFEELQKKGALTYERTFNQRMNTYNYSWILKRKEKLNAPAEEGKPQTEEGTK